MPTTKVDTDRMRRLVEGAAMAPELRVLCHAAADLIDRFPKTADGVHYVDGMCLTAPDGLPIVRSLLSLSEGEWRVASTSGGSWWPLAECRLPDISKTEPTRAPA